MMSERASVHLPGRGLSPYVRVRRTSRGPAVGLLSLVVFAATHLCVGALAAQEQAVVSGRVQDGDTERPVVGAVVTLEGTDFQTVTDAEGAFIFLAIPAGEYTLQVQHLAYGEHAIEIEVEGGVGLSFRVSVSQTAIELEPLVVRAEPSREVRMRTTGSRVNVVTREEIQRGALGGQNLGTLLESQIPGLHARSNAGTVGNPVCVEFRGSRFSGGPCNSPLVVLDGLVTPEPELLFETIPLETIESVEVLSPAQAGVRYGTLGSANGVVLIQTRPPPVRGSRSSLTRVSLTAFDWRQETEPYSWKRVFAAAFLGNAAGLAIGVTLGRQCISFDVESESQSDCGGLATVGAGTASVALPALGGSISSRWAGKTSLSQGRLIPAALGAALAAAAGYAFFLPGSSGGLDFRKFVGGTILLLGPPTVTTTADYLLRDLR